MSFKALVRRDMFLLRNFIDQSKCSSQQGGADSSLSGRGVKGHRPSLTSMRWESIP